MANNTNNGSRLEGRLIEIGELMQQDTDGKVEFLRHKITNEPDGGIDSECKIAPDFDYFKYLRGLKETGGVTEGTLKKKRQSIAGRVLYHRIKTLTENWVKHL